MRKRGIWILTTILVVIGAITFAFLIEKVTVTASDTALTEQGWRAYFSASLNAASLDTDDLYVANEQGKRMAADLALNEEGRSLLVKGLTPGTYTLHVKKNAVKDKSFKSLPVTEVKFSVYETLESVASAKELKAYFERAHDIQKSAQPNFVEEEKSSVEDTAASGTTESADHSTTNNQVDGVDEADNVKTDGEFIYSVTGNGKVVITDIRNPKKLSKASEIKMGDEFYPSQLFLHGDTLVVIGEGYNPHGEASSSETEKVSVMPVNQMTSVRMYNISNRENPLLIREIGTEGYLNGARKAGEILYFVTNVRPNFWIQERLDEGVLRPYAYDSERDEDSKPIDYEDISILPGAIEPSYSVITSVDLSSPTENKVVTKGYLGGSEQLYMSAENLYLTTTLYNGESGRIGLFDTTIWRQGNTNTELFKFALDKTGVAFQSSAELKGSLLNQFSMDEHNGYFRVVTTEGNMWDDKNPSQNHLFILNENLEITGSVEGLAKGERIYSARFMGDKAYMVTFRETDPLFVIDVENPTAPKVLGELKIPGFSNYLHPLDENHLIGFGYETVAKKNPEGGEPFIETLGMKISLFDVSDFSNPKEQDTEVIGGQGTYSAIQYDHKALFTHKERSLYGFPVMIYNESGKSGGIDFKGSGALIYEITPENGIVLKGDLLEGKSSSQQYQDWENEIQRILYSNDELYTIAMKEIKSYSLDRFSMISDVMID